MRKMFITGSSAFLLAMSAAVWAGPAALPHQAAAGYPAGSVALNAKTGGARAANVGPGASVASRIGAPGNSTAYEKAITAYLDNVVEKARKKLPASTQTPPPAPNSGGPVYPGFTPAGGQDSQPTLPRVERITIGLEARAVLETPNGGRLRVSSGVVTPYGQVSAIRAAGVWFLARGSHEAVELADISPTDSSAGQRGQNPQQGAVLGQEQAAGPPPPPNFQPVPHQ